MNTQRKEQRFYVVRIHRQTGEHEYIRQEGYDKLYKRSEGLDEALGYDNNQDANAIAARLNGINDHFEQEYFYTVARRDEITTIIFNDNTPDEVMALFQDDTDGEENTNDDEQAAE